MTYNLQGRFKIGDIPFVFHFYFHTFRTDHLLENLVIPLHQLKTFHQSSTKLL